MRKKKIIEENVNLFNQVSRLKAEIEDLKIDLTQKNSEIEKLKAEISSKPKEETKTENLTPIKEIEKKVAPKALSEDYKYGSEAIGIIVVDSANYSNVLTNGGETKYIELVNLILGKSEIAKSEILSVVCEDISIEDKKIKIDKIVKTAKEYFESVMAQR